MPCSSKYPSPGDVCILTLHPPYSWSPSQPYTSYNRPSYLFHQTFILHSLQVPKPSQHSLLCTQPSNSLTTLVLLRTLSFLTRSIHITPYTPQTTLQFLKIFCPSLSYTIFITQQPTILCLHFLISQMSPSASLLPSNTLSFSLRSPQSIFYPASHLYLL